MAQEIEKDDVAIIGMACRVAGANSPSELWDLLASSKDVQSEITRFNSKGFFHPEGAGRKGMTNVTTAYMMDDNLIDKFDNSFFQIAPNEAIAIDPQQRMLLEIAYETVENAGIPLDDFVGTNAAVYAGMDSCDYHTVLSRDIDATPTYLATGTGACMAANRISYFFNLSGPSFTVDSACSSSMAALHQAVRALEAGDASTALVCGAKLIITPDMFVPSSELGFLSPSGRCRSFDAAADGYGRGEGVLALLLKPLKVALADGDLVRAAIKGIRLNQDGRTNGITLPSSEAQKHNMESLYLDRNLLPGDIQYVEAHGTGTNAGDPLEMSAIDSVFKCHERSQPLIVGSVKSNIGHCESAAALAAIVKTVQCLEKGKIPPQMHYKTPNPKLTLNNVQIPINMMDWPCSRGYPRRAAVNTFGAGGTNGHVVLEAYSPIPSFAAKPERPLLFKISSADLSTLQNLCLNYARYVTSREPNLSDLSYSLLCRRSTLKQSIFFTANTKDEVLKKLSAENPKVYIKGKDEVKTIAFVFTGQGAQWAEMGRVLIEQSNVFKRAILDCEQALASLRDRPSWSITEELLKATSDSNIHRCAYAQPLCTALQIGLVTVWRSWGLFPNAVIGHSSGEIAAAYAAGFLSLRDAMIIAYYRGRYINEYALCTPSGLNGRMCAVGFDEEGARSLLEDFTGRVQLAAVNSPCSCTLSGDQRAIEDILSICQKAGTTCRELKVDIAYHSHHMLAVAPHYEKALAAASLSPLTSDGNCEMFSSVTGQKMSASDCVPLYWRQNMVSTVQFSSAMTEYVQSVPRSSVFLEIGPHPALKGPSTQIIGGLTKSSVNYFSSCIRGRNDLECLLETAADIIAQGIPLRTQNINAREVCRGTEISYEYGHLISDLPAYPWNHSTSYWAESRLSRNLRYRQFPRHQLLGSRYLEDTPLTPSWRSMLMLREMPWLLQMKDQGTEEMPAAIFILVALEAAHQLQTSTTLDALSINLSGLRFQDPLSLASFLNVKTVIELHLNAYQISTDTYGFKILSVSAGSKHGFAQHCSGRLRWSSDAVKRPNFHAAHIEHDRFILERAQSVTPKFYSAVQDLSTSTEGSNGTFRPSTPQNDESFIDPNVLVSILWLPLLSSSGKGLPAKQRISSIGSIVVPIKSRVVHSGAFKVRVQPRHPYGSQSNIEISAKDVQMTIDGLQFEGDSLASEHPSLRSLFFKPIVLPDITTFAAKEIISLSDCFRMISHKWPMCDVAVAGMSDDDTKNILEAIQSMQIEKRPHFRSVEISGESIKQIDNEKIIHVSHIKPEAKFHLLILGEPPSDMNYPNHILPIGYLCARRLVVTKDLQDDERWTPLCPLTGFVEDDWWLWRFCDEPHKPHSGRVGKVFIAPNSGLSSVTCSPSAECVSLDPEAVGEFCHRSDMERFDAFIMDSVDASVIASWPGQTLVPWLQVLLKFADTIIWITRLVSNTPYSNIAGTLLRSLQCEQLSLKVAWLIVGENAEEPDIQANIALVHAASLRGDNEIRYDFRDSQPTILRYLPDGELSSATGLNLPSTTDRTLTGRDYKLSLSTRREPAIISTIAAHSPDIDPGNVEVVVEASLFDFEDVLLFQGVDSETARLGLGRFFAGRVNSGTHSALPFNSRVVGFHAYAHQNRLVVSTQCLYAYPPKIASTTAAAEFAATALSLCIIDGNARARAGDLFNIDISGILREAILRLCDRFEATALEADNEGRADFIVSADSSKGLLLNGSPIRIDDYLQSHHGSRTLAKVWKEGERFASKMEIFELPDYRKAFQKACENPYSTVLLHSGLQRVERSVILHEIPQRLFVSDGAYVIIGGLGGLGRFVCSWMAANGAAVLYVVSRNGVQSEEAQKAVSDVKSSGTIIEVLKADASDRVAISAILSQVREKHLIRGVINMAMLLGDAPMADMTGEQWDRALRLKVDSSWNLHSETLQDPLDFFILFSSIASVLGNRSQAGYNVGNTFLNALAEFRRANGLTAVSIALGAMTDVGVLHELGREDLLRTLSRSGLTPLRKEHLAKIMEAAVLESRQPDRSLILTGLEMFERVDGRLVGRQDQTQLFWTEVPEFGHLQDHRRGRVGADGGGGGSYSKRVNLQERLLGFGDDAEKGKEMLMAAFLEFLAGLLGFESESLPSGEEALPMLGVDSLSAVSCQYWFYRELSIDMSVSEVLGAESIAQIIDDAYMKNTQKELGKTEA